MESLIPSPDQIHPQYSGSYGASNSWMLQSAPFIPNHWYSLSAVTVLRGSVAIAVGGSPFGLSNNAFNNSIAGVVTAGLGVTLPTTTFTIAQAAPLRPSGVVLMTMNGGFRWMSQNLPGWSYWSTVYRGTNGGSFVYDTVLQGDGMLPALNDVACYQSSNAATGASSYSCFAVGDWGYMVQSTIPYNSLSTGVIASAAPTWNFVNVTQVAKQTGYLDFYGIAWCVAGFPWTLRASLPDPLPPRKGLRRLRPHVPDRLAPRRCRDNNVVGYAYGNSFIVSTHDGGNTWVSETPNGIVTSASLSSYVVGLATGARSSLALGPRARRPVCAVQFLVASTRHKLTRESSVALDAQCRRPTKRQARGFAAQFMRGERRGGGALLVTISFGVARRETQLRLDKCPPGGGGQQQVLRLRR